MAIARVLGRSAELAPSGLNLFGASGRYLQPHAGEGTPSVGAPDGAPTDGHDAAQRAVAVVGGEADTAVTGNGGAKPVAVAAPSQLSTREWSAAVLVATGAIVVGAGVGIAVLPDPDGPTYRISSDFSAFAALFVLALAVERLLQPLARWSGTADAKDARDEAEAATVGVPVTRQLVKTFVDAQAELDKARQRAAIAHWGVAVGVSAAVVGSLDVLLLTALAAGDSARPNRVVDLLVTAFVVGAGTKPLHDLVSKLEKKKEQGQDPSSVGGTA